MMDKVRVFWNYMAAVATLQSAIEGRFGFDWSDSGKTIVKMEKYYPVFRAIREDVELDKYCLVNWPPAVVVCYMGYGPKTNQFVYCGIAEYPN
jgi:hypothetical protein